MKFIEEIYITENFVNILKGNNKNEENTKFFKPIDYVVNIKDFSMKDKKIKNTFLIVSGLEADYINNIYSNYQSANEFDNSKN